MKILLLISLFHLSLYAQMPQWLSEIYAENNNYFELECTYFTPSNHKVIKPISETSYSKNFASRDFQILSPNSAAVNLRFELEQSDKTFAKIFINNQLHFEKRIKKTKDREFYLPYPSGENELELNDIYCEINFAENRPVTISSDTLLNIHPHTNYDYRRLTSAGTSSLAQRFPILIMLEDGNYKGDLANLSRFLESGTINLPQNYWEMTSDYNSSAQYVISPAGHNRFVWGSLNEVDVHYTGGNHNYCIWNNTRNLLRAYFKSYSKETVNINYHMNAIVAQTGGIISGLSFDRKHHSKSPLLADLLSDSSVANSYVQSYHNYFTIDFISEFTAYFKTLKIKTIFKDKVLVKEFHGTGHLNKEINFYYK